MSKRTLVVGLGSCRRETNVDWADCTLQGYDPKPDTTVAVATKLDDGTFPMLLRH